MAPNSEPTKMPNNRVTKPQHKKLPRLPKDAQVTKRPLLRPTIPSPYTSSSTQKVVYISTRTPFMSAVKRVEKLLNLADKRDVQAATTQASKNKRKRRRDDEEDEVMTIARGVEEGKDKKRRAGRVSGEEVLVKGTGKAVGKVMEIGAWFLQRDAFEVRVRTGSVGALDDVEVPEGKEEGDGAGGEEMDVDQAEAGAEKGATAVKGQDEGAGKGAEAISGTRVRYLSVLEVAVSLR